MEEGVQQSYREPSPPNERDRDDDGTENRTGTFGLLICKSYFVISRTHQPHQGEVDASGNMNTMMMSSTVVES